jgi:phosphoglycolate phosphatase
MTLIDRLLLFDIDGTLVVTGGAGQRAMNRAFHEVFGIPDAFAGIDLAGRTDTSIIGDAFTRQGMAADELNTARFRGRYLECLQDEVPRPGAGKRVLPGIQPLLEALDPEPRSFLGLLTGNFADAAEVKLAHFDLWRYFKCGAFGEDHGDRNHLVPVALARAQACGLPTHVEPAGVIVIGDTPRDVACAHAHGARCVAVATGEYTADRLRLAGADVVFEDLSDTAAVLEALGKVGRSVGP